MPAALTKSSAPEAPEVTATKARNRKRLASKSVAASFAGKKFGDLTPLEKDDALKAALLALGLIEQD